MEGSQDETQQTAIGLRGHHPELAITLLENWRRLAEEFGVNADQNQALICHTIWTPQ
jgi:hypothetical protein